MGQRQQSCSGAAPAQWAPPPAPEPRETAPTPQCRGSVFCRLSWPWSTTPPLRLHPVSLPQGPSRHPECMVLDRHGYAELGNEQEPTPLEGVAIPRSPEARLREGRAGMQHPKVPLVDSSRFQSSHVADSFRSLPVEQKGKRQRQEGGHVSTRPARCSQEQVMQLEQEVMDLRATVAELRARLAPRNRPRFDRSQRRRQFDDCVAELEEELATAQQLRQEAVESAVDDKRRMAEEWQQRLREMTAAKEAAEMRCEAQRTRLETVGGLEQRIDQQTLAMEVAQRELGMERAAKAALEQDYQRQVEVLELRLQRELAGARESAEAAARQTAVDTAVQLKAQRDSFDRKHRQLLLRHATAKSLISKLQAAPDRVAELEQQLHEQREQVRCKGVELETIKDELRRTHEQFLAADAARSGTQRQMEDLKRLMGSWQ